MGSHNYLAGEVAIWEPAGGTVEENGPRRMAACTGNQLHRYSTRYSDFYRTHLCRTNTKKFSLLFQGPKIWNSLPNHIKATTSAPSFKRLMKSFLRDRQNEFKS